MFRTIRRLCLPNPLDRLCKKAQKKGQRKILLGWNRGLGDIALGLYAIVERIHSFIPDAQITFLVRPNLLDGFSMLQRARAIAAPHWKRGEPYDIDETLRQLRIAPEEFDLIIPRPSPTDWVRWQRGKVVPKLAWNPQHEELFRKFGLSSSFTYYGVQAVAETQYGLWRNWPELRWRELFAQLADQERVLLFGMEAQTRFESEKVIDLRGKTSLFELLSIIKNCCRGLVLPDSGILSMTYYLDVSFPIRIVSLWADPDHGILKQAVASPNPLLKHSPLIGQHRDLSTVVAEDVLKCLRSSLN